MKAAQLKLLVIILNILHSCCSFDLGKISCSQNLVDLDVDSNEEKVTVECPHSCLQKVYCIVRGSGPYLPSSSICCAAVHSGVLANADGGCAALEISYKSVPHVLGSLKNEVKSRNYFGSSVTSFMVKNLSKPVQHTEGSEYLEATTATSTTETVTTSRSTQSVDENEIEPTTISATTKNTTVVTRPASAATDKGVVHMSSTTSLPTAQDISRSMTKPITVMTLKNVIKAELHLRVTQPNAPQYTTADNLHLLGHLHEKVLILIAGIVIGVLALGAVVFVRRRVKKSRRGRHQHCGERRSKSTKGTSRAEDSGICVCYQNLNTSRQGLLTDPETCDRPCSMKKPLNCDQSLLMTDSFDSLPSTSQTLLNFEKESSCCKDAYDDCSSGCSEKCNPSQFDF